MKRLVCILGCIVSSTQIVHAMEGVLYGGMATAFVGLCYATGTSDSIESKITRLTYATTAGAAMGGMTQLLLRALQKNHASVAATVTAALGCGFAQMFVLSKIISDHPQT